MASGVRENLTGKNDSSMHLCIKAWHRHFSIQLLWDTQFSLLCIVTWSRVLLTVGNGVSEKMSLEKWCVRIFFSQTRRVTKKENNNRCRRWCIMSSPTQCRYPRCIASNADLLRASSRRIAWRFLWKSTSYTQLLWICCCGLVIIISIFAGSVESLSKG